MSGAYLFIEAAGFSAEIKRHFQTDEAYAEFQR